MTAAGRIVSGTFYKIFVIDFPAKGPRGALGSRGSWRLAIGGKKGAAYEAAASSTPSVSGSMVPS